jgi:hypothetical protein
MRTLQDALCTADAVRQLKERGAKLDADMQDQLALADEIEKLRAALKLYVAAGYGNSTNFQKQWAAYHAAGLIF